jgi:hypothetical protein
MEQHDERINPFAAPQSTDSVPMHDAAGGDPQHIPREVVALLLSTRNWVVLFGVLAAMVAFGFAFGAFFKFVSGDTAGAAPRSAHVGACLFAAALCAAACYWFGAYASGITAYAADISSTNLTAALKAQKSLWKFVGLVAIVYTGILVMSLIVFAWVTMTHTSWRDVIQ